MGCYPFQMSFRYQLDCRSVSYRHAIFHQQLISVYLYLYTICCQLCVDFIDQVEHGVRDRLHIYPQCGISYFAWHRHQIEGTDSF